MTPAPRAVPFQIMSVFGRARQAVIVTAFAGGPGTSIAVARPLATFTGLTLASVVRVWLLLRLLAPTPACTLR